MRPGGWATSCKIENAVTDLPQPDSPWDRLLEKAEQLKASVRAKVEHPFRVIKCQFGFTKVCNKGLARNTAQLMTFFALSNVWMARRHLLGVNWNEYACTAGKCPPEH